MFIIYIFSKKYHIKCNYAGTFDVSSGVVSNVIISNVISFVLGDSNADSENVSLKRRFISDGQKICSSKVVSLIGI